MLLSDSKIKSIKANGKKQSFADGAGLALVVTATGSKLWQFRYDRPHKPTRVQNSISLGAYPTVSLKAARLKRDEYKVLLYEGIDPAVIKKQEKEIKVASHQRTIRLVATEWFNHYKTSISPDHAKRVWRRLELNLFANVGNEPVSHVTTETFIRLIKKIVARGSYDVAKRTLKVCQEIFRYATVYGYISQNPIENIKPKDIIPRRDVQNQKRVDVSEFPQLVKDINNYSGNRLHQLALKLMMHVFVRHDELRFAEWREFDFDKKLWTIPAEKMKMKSAHIVPLTEQSIDILNEIKLFTGNKKFLFQSQTSSNCVMSEKAMPNILHKLGYQGKQTIHGFRGLASTILNEHGLHPDHIEAQLAHKDPNTTRAAYNHAQYLPHRVKLMNFWSGYLTNIECTKG